MNKIFSFIKESKEELKKVTWPTRQRTINYTITVVVISLLVALFLGVLDMIFSMMMEMFII
jgi:preprotein translocase subunit SecE